MAPRPKVYHRICHVCHVDKPVAEFPKYSGKCFACVVGKAKGKLITCVQCGQVKKLCARGMCNKCYNLAHPRHHLVRCSKCHQVTMLEARGLCRRCYSNSRYHKDPQAWNKRKREREKANPEKVQAYNKKRYQERKASGYEHKQYRRYYLQNRDKLIEYQKSYRHANPDTRTHHHEARQARLAGLPYDLTREQWKQILREHNYTCFYCGKRGGLLHREHKNPLTRGGGYTYTNIVPACPRCNARKGTKTEDEFREHLKKFPN